MQTPQRFHIDKCNRRSLNVVVFINLHGGVFLAELSGTKYDGYVPHQYTNQKGEPAHKLVKEEYISCVKAADDYFRHASRYRRFGSDILLVHDRGTVHHTEPIPGVPWTPVNHPPRSRDLMPLEYGIFGFTKNKLLQELKQLDHVAKWEERVEKFKELSRGTPVQGTITEFVLRMKACIAAHGLSFKSEQKKLKKASLEKE
jgi:hypothetical protein